MKVILLITLIVCWGCDSEEGLKEQTQIQTKEEIQAQNENLKEWSEKLSKDLEVRRSFISAVEGEFEGRFLVEQTSFSISMKIIATIPDYEITRVRTLAELEYELQNLNLNVHVVQWNPESNMSAVGCVFENIRPDSGSGIVSLMSADCPNSYELSITENSDVALNDKARSDLALLIRNGQVKFVLAFNGKLKSSSAGNFDFNMNRVR